MQVTFRADASSRIGGGHVMRCLALADALAERGARCSFVSAWMLTALETTIAAHGHRLLRIDEPAPPPRGAGWEAAALDASAQRRDGERTLASAGPADWAVVDHYWLGTPWEAQLRARQVRVLAIDDLQREHACDLLLDQTAGRSSDEYRGRVPADATVLAGSAYALLRPEFRTLRPHALERRRAGGPVQRLLVSLGLSDVGGITAEVLDALTALDLQCAIDVVVGAEAASREHVEAAAKRDQRVTVHVDPGELARLSAQADIGIGAPGSSSLERCCLGLPSINLPLAENQRELGQRLADLGAALCVGKDEVSGAVGTLLGDEDRRLRMAAAAAGVTDGTGAEILAARMLSDSAAGDMRTRAATAEDSERIWLWRNDPGTRERSQTRHAVTWAEHQAWFGRTMASPDHHLFIAERSSEPVAMLRFDKAASADPAFVVSINVRPTARGGGTGKAALAEACRAFLAANGPARLEAMIHADNVPSRNIFESLGFRYSGPDGDSSFGRFVREA